jgi:predicted dehydrogenase
MNQHDAENRVPMRTTKGRTIMDIMSRRSFLNATAFGMAAVPVALSQSAWSAPEQVPASEKVRVGLIGCGGIGKVDLETFFLNAEVDCPVVCDVDDAQIAKAVELVEGKRGHKPDTVKDFRRVIDRKDVDVLLVATPDHWHALPTIYGCQAGKDVYCEKPLGKCIGEGRAMLEAAKDTKRVVQMGTHWRSGTHYREAVEFVQSGKLGPIRMVRAWSYLDWIGGIGNPPDSDPPAGVDYDMWLGPAPLRPFNKNRFHFNFRWFWDYAGGLMTDWGVHLLNICLWAMTPEMPLRVGSMGGKYVLNDAQEQPDTSIAVFDYPKYTLIFEQQTLGGIGPGNKPHGMLFSGTEGTLIIDEGGWEVIPEPKKKTVEAYKGAPGRDARPAHVRNFLDCVKSRENPVENLEVGHFVSTVAHLGNLAYRTKTEIHWDAKTEHAIENPAADGMVMCDYRAPWKLPYNPRA